MKIGVYGGSFNPIHLGHIKMAQQIAGRQGLDRVIFIPAACSPFKTGEDYASDIDRLNMCRLALKGYGNFEVSDIEISRGGVSYTAETLKALKELYPDDKLYLIMGADMFLSLKRWRLYTEIFRIADICAVPRNGDDSDKLKAFAEDYKNEGARVFIHNIELLPYSSTEIRKRIKEGKSIKELTTASTAQYIAENGLYL